MVVAECGGSCNLSPPTKLISLVLACQAEAIKVFLRDPDPRLIGGKHQSVTMIKQTSAQVTSQIF
jgi:hypothetical protein